MYQLDFDKLPPFANYFLKEFFMAKFPFTPPESMLLHLEMACSRLLCYNRIKIENKDGHTGSFPNLYSIVFMPSGMGKDAPGNELNKAIRSIYLNHQSLEKNYHKGKIESVRMYADSQQWTKFRKEGYVKDNEPRILNEEVDKGTIEGITSIREGFFDANFGSVHYRNSEFADYVASSKDGSKIEFLSFIKELYENGDSLAKQIKNNKSPINVYGVPQTMLVHSSLSGLMEDEKSKKLLKDFLNRGLTRRSLVCYPDQEFKYIEQTDEEKFAKRKSSQAVGGELLELFKTVNNATTNIILSDKDNSMAFANKEIIISDEAYRLLSRYENEVNSRMVGIKEDYQANSLTDNPRKTLRLAAVIACFSHPDNITILAEDFEYAKYQVEFFAKQFMKFYEIEPENDTQKLYSFIKSNQVICDVTKTRIRNSKISPKNNFENWLSANLIGVQEFCEENGEVLKNNKGRGLKEWWTIEKLEEENIEEITEDFKLIGSKAKTFDNPKDTAFKEVSFFALEKMDKFVKNTSYSAFVFDEDYRLSVNSKACQMIGIDIDNDGGKQLSLLEAKELFKDYIHVICTTRNHQREKGDGEKKKPSKDRYRVLLLLKTPYEIKDTESYKNIYLNIMKEFCLESIIDSSCNDAARFFYPSPADCYYEFVTKGKFIDIDKFDIPVPEKKKYEPSKNYSSGIDNSSKILTLADGSCKNFSEFEYLQVGDKGVPIYCPDHDDSNPSAFIKRANNNDQNIYYHCSACGKSTFIK